VEASVVLQVSTTWSPAVRTDWKSLAFALSNIFTRTSFLIAAISALIGNAVFEYLRKKL
jgi:hypothetical protein